MSTSSMLFGRFNKMVVTLPNRCGALPVEPAVTLPRGAAALPHKSAAPSPRSDSAPPLDLASDPPQICPAPFPTWITAQTNFLEELGWPMAKLQHGTHDMEGKTWMQIPVPDTADDCIHQAQGRLCLINVDGADASKLSIWILEDHGTHEWTLKHSVRTLLLFRKKNLRFDLDYIVITVHPECNLIYFVYEWDTLMTYQMDRKEDHVIRKLGHDCWRTYLPYVPLFSEALADRAVKLLHSLEHSS